MEDLLITEQVVTKILPYLELHPPEELLDMTACSFLLTSYVVAVLSGRIVAVMGRANPRTTSSLP
jgi:hypothetical protein